MAGDDRTFLLADALLTTAAATLRPARLPSRRYVAPGPRGAAGPTHDCAQLVTYFGPWEAFAESTRGATPVTTSIPSKASSSPAIPVVNFRVQLVIDCVPQPVDKAPPSAADLTAFAEDVLTDYRDLHRGLLAARHSGTLFGALVSDCEGATVGQIVPGGPQGAVVWAICDIALNDMG